MTQPTEPASSASAASEQPQPIRNPNSVEVTPRLVKHCENGIFASVDSKWEERLWAEIKDDLLARNELGIKTYGTPLYTFNGRNAVLDAYQETLDAAKYYQQYVMEQGHTTSLVMGKILMLLHDLKEILVLQQVKPDPPVRAG